MATQMTLEARAALDHFRMQIEPCFDDAFEPLFHEVALALAGLPEDEADLQMRGLCHALVLAMEIACPNLSTAMRFGLPYVFLDIARDRMKLMAQAGCA